MNTPTDHTNSTQSVSGSAQPRKWWQWFLLYPVFATSIIAAVPTYLEVFKSTKYEVAFGQSSDAKVQDDMWQTNLQCSSAPLEPYKTSFNYEVDATICESGDVLVKIFAPNGKKYYKWVSINNIVKDQLSTSWLISTAYASETGNIQLAQNGTVLCEVYLQPGRVKRRVQTSQGCVDEIVNTYTGVVESTTPSECNNKC